MKPRIRLVAGPGGVRAEGEGQARLGHALGADPLAGGPPPEGVFAAWNWDGERLLVRTDRYGMHPLYYRSDANSLTLSPDPLALLRPGEHAALDHDALAVFVRLGFFLAEDTPFAAIRALPPAATLTWTRDGPRLDAPALPVPGPADLTRGEAVDGFIDLFRASVARRLPARPYDLPLSGGRDSRHILLELCRQGAPPRLCVSGAKFPPDPGADARVAALLAGHLGLPHRTVGRPRSQFHAERAAGPAQGMGTLDGAWALPLLSFLRRRSGLWYDGLGGGELAQNPSIELIRKNPYDATDPPGLADRLLTAGRTGGHVEHLLGPRTRGLWSRERARARLVRELTRHADAPLPLGSFFFWNRTRRSIALAPFTLGGGQALIHTPYLDHALVDHLASVPGRFLVDGTFHDQALHKAFPEHAGLGFAAAVPQRHGLVLVGHRLAYLTRLLGHTLHSGRGWWHSRDRVLQRLLAAGRGPGAPQRVSRLQPLALYLLQLESLAAGRTP
ncbi:asparagine synthase [Streptomyces sp. WAC 04229]|uniref:asparagine synthetase B family protein n=1 Tax=Streptomyces sp. WAC 04229 TaxID=2203206 RepID=UPI000F738585|nr:asparagine synthetase B family protein [Streptomyces sp. WAC 04229]RSN64140.1 asparagine synthase [Streptomyces sp. WAC 04229]